MILLGVAILHLGKWWDLLLEYWCGLTMSFLTLMPSFFMSARLLTVCVSFVIACVFEKISVQKFSWNFLEKRLALVCALRANFSFNIVTTVFSFLIGQSLSSTKRHIFLYRSIWIGHLISLSANCLFWSLKSFSLNRCKISVYQVINKLKTWTDSVFNALLHKKEFTKLYLY